MNLVSISARIAALGLVTFCAVACQGNLQPLSQAELAPAQAAFQNQSYEDAWDALDSYEADEFDRSARPIFYLLAGDINWEMGETNTALRFYRDYIQTGSQIDSVRVGNRILQIGTELITGERRLAYGLVTDRMRGESLLEELAMYHPRRDDIKANALLRLGQYHLEKGAYTEAINDFERLLTAFRGVNKYNDIGTFRAAQASFYRIVSPESGVTDMRKARELLTSYRDNFRSNGLYTQEAEALLFEVDSLIAQHYVVVGDFYSKINNYGGARRAYHEAEKYHGTDGAKDALKKRQALPLDEPNESDVPEELDAEETAPAPEPLTEEGN